MISKGQIKHINSLHLKKNRTEERLFLAEGMKIVSELLNLPEDVEEEVPSYQVHSIYAVERWMHENAEFLAASHIEAVTVSEIELGKISALTTPQQVLAVVKMPDYQFNIKQCKQKLSLILDEISDPGNLGTIIRIADWFGIENIICSEDTVELYNPKVVQATMGSIFRVKVFYHNLDALLRENKSLLKLPVYAAVMGGPSVYTAPLGHEGFIIMGNESEGIERDLFHYVDHALTIPSFSQGHSYADSLNVAVATAIVCSEFRRR